MLMYSLTALYGNTLELFIILTGVGRNGKSKLIELLELVFGDYYSSVSSALFMRPRLEASSPDPGLLNLSKKKIITSAEPEKKYKLNTGFIKFITGRDNVHWEIIIQMI
jgi:putative DNA primase/helicase